MLVAALVAVQVAAVEPPLFASNAPVEVVIQGPISALTREAENPVPKPSLLIAEGVNYRVDLEARGITRRKVDVCTFPPLRISFSPSPTAGLFAGQRRLKLVTHCRPSEGHQQHVLLEYAAYRLFNALSPLSFRVRPLRIEYRQPDGRPVTRRFGFVIEDEFWVARRNNLRALRAPNRISSRQLSPADAARVAVFNYMIGNLDWSMTAGPTGERCCHNARLAERGGAQPYVPVPYDFDFSGLVDAPYATPPEAIPMRNVRVRRYRGYCAHNGEALAAAAEFRAKRTQLEAVLDELPELTPGTRRKALSYLATFFADVADPQTISRKLFAYCT